tara:strand:- start:33 stop:506 length:474 start_codon:yes stop_codon:yes gene_type:complete
MKVSNTILILIASALIGVLFGQLEIFALLKIGFLITVVFGVSVLAFILGIIFNKKRMTLNSLRAIGILLLISFATLITSGIHKDSKESRAKEIIVDLKSYKSINGIYPDSLTQIGINDDNYKYYLENNKSDFTLRYIIDGWHYNQYSSEDEIWQGGD